MNCDLHNNFYENDEHEWVIGMTMILMHIPDTFVRYSCQK